MTTRIADNPKATERQIRHLAGKDRLAAIRHPNATLAILDDYAKSREEIEACSSWPLHLLSNPTKCVEILNSFEIGPMSDAISDLYWTTVEYLPEEGVYSSSAPGMDRRVTGWVIDCVEQILPAWNEYAEKNLDYGPVVTELLDYARSWIVDPAFFLDAEIQGIRRDDWLGYTATLRQMVVNAGFPQAAKVLDAAIFVAPLIETNPHDGLNAFHYTSQFYEPNSTAQRDFVARQLQSLKDFTEGRVAWVEEAITRAESQKETHGHA